MINSVRVMPIFIFGCKGFCFVYSQKIVSPSPPESIWRVISLLLPKFAYGIVNGAPNFVADLPQLLTEGELSFIPVPVIVPLSPAIAGVVPVPRWR